MSSSENKNSEIKFYHRSWLGKLTIRSWGKVRGGSPWNLLGEDAFLKIANDPVESEASQNAELAASSNLPVQEDLNNVSILSNDVALSEETNEQNDIGIEIKISTSNPAFMKVYKRLYNFKRKLFDFSDEQLFAQYKLQKKINDLDAKLLANVADPNISTDALIALRHLALDYRSRQQELLKKQPWYKNLLSSSDRDKGDEQLIGVTKTTYDLIESNPQS
ncbi:MAG: hypothetical protein EBT10_04690 [Methylocystaceae bacterium]|nr:hypothetical protein [Methylocystaceae bacterium]